MLEFEEIKLVNGVFYLLPHPLIKVFEDKSLAIEIYFMKFVNIF